MAMMPIGPITLTAMLILLHFDVLAVWLHREGLPRQRAVGWVSAMLLGSFYTMPLGAHVSMNIGEVLLPLLASGAVLSRERSVGGVLRMVGAAIGAAAATYALGIWLRPGGATELNLFRLDAQYLFAFTGAAIGALIGRTPRTAAAAAVLGVVGADVGHYTTHVLGRADAHAVEYLGGAGFAGTPVLAAIGALVLANWLTQRTALSHGGESRDRDLPQS